MSQWWARRRGLSFRARLGSTIAIAVGLTVALASVASYFVVRHQLVGQVDSSLQSDVVAAKNLSLGGVINPGLASRFLQRTTGGFLQVITSSGLQSTSLSSGGFQPTRAQEAVAAAGDGSRYDTVNYQGVDYRVLTQAAADLRDPGQTLGIQIARPMTDLERTLSTLRLILWLVAAAGIAAAVAIGFFLGRTMLRPVERLTAAAEHVAATQDLGARIEEEDGDDELGRLARSFNAMLTALAASREQQAQLISDAGHELRTPLTSLRTNIEVLMRVRELPAADRADLVHDVEAQMEELTTLIGDLVDLARQEEKQLEPIEVRFDSIVERAVERARRRAPGVTFDVHLTPGAVKASPALLERAVLNVLDNAAKWSPPDGTVEVWLQRGACWTLDIHDHGPGISAADLPHVFDRFYRAETARSMPGSGLGLAIVHQVVADHGGAVRASVPPEGGTLVHIELPIVVEVEDDSAGERDRGSPDWATPPPPRAPGPAGEVVWSGSRRDR